MRAKREFLASKDLFDLIVFVDASGRLPLEGKESCTISKDDADIIIANNGNLDELRDKAYHMGRMIYGGKNSLKYLEYHEVDVPI